MKALYVFQLNIFNILYFMYKYKQNLNPPVFRNVFTNQTKTKCTLGNEQIYAEQILVSIAFHIVDNTFVTKYYFQKT